ncbi:MAG: nucleotidyltransferase family protein [Rickettsiales bacterium]|nr:nucleotidyltransferase family protein [Rickettsiales bacterium]
MPSTTYPIIDASEVCLTQNAPILEAMQRIEASVAKIALVVDDAGKLIGSLTDGDIRRGLIRGCNMETPIAQIMHSSPYTMPVHSTRQQLLEMMQVMDIRQIPLVNPDQTVAGIVMRQQLLGQKRAPQANSVVLMAGGKGQRLLPLTTHIPKPMVEINGRPMLDWILHNFINQGFSQFHVCINHLGHVIEEYFGDGSTIGCNINYVRESKFLGTAGALSLLNQSIDKPFIVMNGDIMVSVDFANIIEFHQASGAVATVCAREHKLEVPFGVIQMKNGLLNNIVEKPIYEDLVSAGIYVISPEVLSMVPTDTHIDMPNLLLSLVQAKKKVAVFPLRENWLDVGRHDDLEKARLTLVSNQS